MSAEVYEVISLASRYLFALLGVLIVLRAFAWLLSDRAEKHARLRKLPDAGTVGELIVLNADSNELIPGMSIPVPYEGILGSVRSCDIVLPASDVRKSHLFFSFVSGSGLHLHPFRGCNVLADGILLDARSNEKAHPLVHGSCLQVGSVMLRLHLFSGLDPATEVDPSFATVSCAGVESGMPYVQPVSWVPPMQDGSGFVSGRMPDQSSYPVPDESAQTVSISSVNDADIASDVPVSPLSDIADSSVRKRRSDRWEADWSE